MGWSGRPLQRFAVAISALWLLAATPGKAWPDTTLHLTTGNDYKPFADESLPAGGMAAEIVAEVYRRLGIETTFHFLPWNRSYELAARGDFLATFPYVKTQRRQEDFFYSDPIFVVETKAMVMDEADLNASSLDELAGRSYCQPLGYATENTAKLHEMTEAGALSRYKPFDMSRCIEMLALGRVDFVFINKSQGLLTAREVLGSSEDVTFLDIEFEDHPLYVLFSRSRADSAEALAEFNAGLAGLKASGRYDEIIGRHLE